MANCKGISLTNWIAILVLALGIMTFVHTQVSSTKEEINANILKVDDKVTDLSGKLDNHIQFHLNNKLCQPQGSQSLLGGIADAEKAIKAPEKTREADTQSIRQ